MKLVSALWTIRDDAVLEAMWRTPANLVTIAARVGRSPSATLRRARELRLPGPERYSLRQVCEVLGCTPGEVLARARAVGMRPRRAPDRSLLRRPARRRPWAFTRGQVDRLSRALCPASDRLDLGTLVQRRLASVAADACERRAAA